MTRSNYLCSASVAALLAFAGVSSPALAQVVETTTYTYDVLGRVVNVHHTGTVNNGLDAGYTYDAADNRTNVTVTGAGSNPVTFSIGNASVTEGGIASFTVTKTGTASGTVSVNYATSTGTAGASDFTAASGTLSFLSSDTSKAVSVQTTQDALVEGNETFSVALSNPSAGATIGTGTGTGTIVDDDSPPPPPSFAISDASVTEGGTLSFTVTKTGSTSSSFTVNYATADVTAVAGSDYTASSGTLTFTSAQTSQNVTVSTIDDGATESSETLAVNLSGASGGAAITDAQGIGTIVDNDPSTLTVTVPVDSGTLTTRNLRTLADNAGYTGSSSATVTFNVSGAVTGPAGASSGAGGMAIDTGSWPVGVSLTLHVMNGGVVSGGGGGGGNGGGSTGGATAGGAGGDAVYVRAALTVTVDSGGVIRAAGGGGGGADGSTFAGGIAGGAGGGGGAPNGSGGGGGVGSGGGANGGAGSPGTTAGGGATGTSGPPGGAGGTYATPGNAALSSGGAGGAAGFAIRKNGNTVSVTNNGTITGTQG